MTKTTALEIVLDLAEQNAISLEDMLDPVMKREADRQWRAIEVINGLYEDILDQELAE